MASKSEQDHLRSAAQALQSAGAALAHFVDLYDDGKCDESDMIRAADITDRAGFSARIDIEAASQILKMKKATQND